MKDLFRYRYLWMGVAIILVMFFHSEMTFDNTVVARIQEFGYGGVDIFMFASGIGCYYSLAKNSDNAEFMKRRFLRIMPVYLCFMVVWLLYRRIWFDMSITSMIGNLFCVQNFTGKGNEFNWYVSAMWLMYLLAPLFASVTSKLKSRKGAAAVLAVLLLFTLSFWYSYTYIITIARIPVFFLGMLAAKMALEGFVLRKRHIAGLAAALVAGVGLLLWFNTAPADRTWLMGGLWYPFILIAPSLCLLLSLACNALERTKAGKWLVGAISAVGKKSFELYLVHIFVFDIFKNMIAAKGICPDNNMYRLLLLIPIAVGAIVLAQVNRLVKRNTLHT